MAGCSGVPQLAGPRDRRSCGSAATGRPGVLVGAPGRDDGLAPAAHRAALAGEDLRGEDPRPRDPRTVPPPIRFVDLEDAGPLGRFRRRVGPLRFPGGRADRRDGPNRPIPNPSRSTMGRVAEPLAPPCLPLRPRPSGPGGRVDDRPSPPREASLRRGVLGSARGRDLAQGSVEGPALGGRTVSRPPGGPHPAGRPHGRDREGPQGVPAAAQGPLSALPPRATERASSSEPVPVARGALAPSVRHGPRGGRSRPRRIACGCSSGCARPRPGRALPEPAARSSRTDRGAPS